MRFIRLRNQMINPGLITDIRWEKRNLPEYHPDHGTLGKFRVLVITFAAPTPSDVGADGWANGCREIRLGDPMEAQAFWEHMLAMSIGIDLTNDATPDDAE